MRMTRFSRSIHSRFFSALLGLCLIFVATAAMAAEDITIVSRLTTKKGEPRTSTQYLTQTKVRTAEGSSDTIFDYTAATMTFIDHSKKQYWKTTPQEIEAAFAELNEMMDSNPILGRMLGKDVTVSVEKTGKTREVAGYSCVEYHATLGKAYEFDLCAAPDLKAPLQYHEARRVFYTTMGPMAGRMEKLLDEMQKIDGLPLATSFSVRMMGQEFESTSEATEVKLGPVPADAFDVPAGYKEKKSPYAKKK